MNPPFELFSRPLCSTILAWSLLGGSIACAQDSHSTDWFETNIRPILAEKCFDCHGQAKQWSGLRLDSREALQKGSDSGQVIRQGDLASSSLLERIVSDDPDFKMPPGDSKHQLTQRDQQLLRRWILEGAWYPATNTQLSNNAKTHWAFQSPQYQPPDPASIQASSHWIDAYLQAKLSEHRLVPLGVADRRARRADDHHARCAQRHAPAAVRGHGAGESAHPGTGKSARPGTGESARPGIGESTRPGIGESVCPRSGERANPIGETGSSLSSRRIAGSLE